MDGRTARRPYHPPVAVGGDVCCGDLAVRCCLDPYCTCLHHGGQVWDPIDKCWMDDGRPYSVDVRVSPRYL